MADLIIKKIVEASDNGDYETVNRLFEELMEVV